MTEKTYLPLHVDAIDKYIGGLLPGELMIVRPLSPAAAAKKTMGMVLRHLAGLQEHWVAHLPVLTLQAHEVSSERLQQTIFSINDLRRGREVKDPLFLFLELPLELDTESATNLLRMVRGVAKEMGFVVVAILAPQCSSRLNNEADIVIDVLDSNADDSLSIRFVKIRRVDLLLSREEINQLLARNQRVESQYVQDELKIFNTINELINQETVDLGDEVEPREGDVREVLYEYLRTALPDVGISVGLNIDRIEVNHHAAGYDHAKVVTLPVCLVKHVFGLA